MGLNAPLMKDLRQGCVMDQRTIIVLNWMAFMLLAPATIILVWKVVSDRLKGKRSPSDLLSGAQLLGLAVIAVAQLNIDGRPLWLRLMLLAAQLILLVFLFKGLWPALKQRLRE